MASKPPPSPEDTALLDAIQRVLVPLARLGVGRGQPFAVVEELFKRAYVNAAREMHGGAAHRDVSRVATTTGLTRREVTRLLTNVPAAAAERASPATQLFTRWRTDRRYRDARGRPRTLPRQGPAPSFETLAASITRDVHPRSLLDELCRLNLARYDERRDVVRIVREAFVPREDVARLYGFLGRNAGDHLSAAVANVLGTEPVHFEQAIFADELSPASVEVARQLVRAQWRALTAAVVPELEALIAADRQARGDEPSDSALRRLRIGLYAFDDAMADDDPQEDR